MVLRVLVGGHVVSRRGPFEERRVGGTLQGRGRLKDRLTTCGKNKQEILKYKDLWNSDKLASYKVALIRVSKEFYKEF